MFVESHLKSIEGFEYIWALFVAKHIFTLSVLIPLRGSVPPRRDIPAQERTLSLGYSAAGALSNTGTAALTGKFLWVCSHSRSDKKKTVLS